jgi:4'-phosphopantetheinyl transferase
MQPSRGQTDTGAARAAQLWLATPEYGMGAGASGAARMARRAIERTTSRELLAAARAPGMPRRSLSHSGGCAAIAIAPAGSRAGVDIEAVAPRDVHGISHFAFSLDEARELDSFALPAATARFYVLWTLKEAFAKALAVPLLVAMRECSFAYRDGRWTGRVPTAESWRAAVFTPRPLLTLAAVIVGRCDCPCADWTCHEWPSLSGPAWPRVATLVSGDLPDAKHAATESGSTAL